MNKYAKLWATGLAVSLVSMAVRAADVAPGLTGAVGLARTYNLMRTS